MSRFIEREKKKKNISIGKEKDGSHEASQRVSAYPHQPQLINYIIVTTEDACHEL